MSEGFINFLPWLVPTVIFGLVAVVWLGKLIWYLMNRDARPKQKLRPKEPQSPRSGDIVIGYIRKDK